MFSSKEIVIRTKTTVFVATLLLQAVTKGGNIKRGNWLATPNEAA